MAKATCSIEGCELPASCRTWCPMHYTRWQRHGDPMVRVNIATKTKLVWLRALAAKQDGDGCRDWPFGLDPHGYPRRLAGAGSPAHIVLTLTGQPRPSAEMEACHSCDRPSCVAHWHLRWGTRKENLNDMVERGRSNAGERHPLAKLTREAVVAIRAEYRPGSGRTRGNSRELAERYGVGTQAIRDAARGRHWG